MNYLKTVLFIALMGITGLATAQTPHDQLTFPEINRFVMPKIETFTLRNGITVFLVEDKELPIIQLDVLVRTGSFLVPAEKAGLASMVGQVMRTGGSVAYPAAVLNPLLENKAASVETSVGFTTGSASLNVLKEDFEPVLSVLIDLLRNPLFPQEQIDLAKTQQRSGISRRNDDASGITNREFRKLIYGANSVFTRGTEYATIDAITREDMVEFHKKGFVGRNMTVSVIGDFNTRDMRRSIERAFNPIPAGSKQSLNLPDVKYEFKAGVNFIAKNDVNQSNILLGHIGGLRNNPDYAALQMMNEILSGGSFSGRLMQEVRTNKGYAYGVGGAYQSSILNPGQFFVSLSTASASTADAIRSTIGEIRKMQDAPVSETEVSAARDRILNSLVFRYESRADVLNERVSYAYYGLPADLFDRYIEDLRNVTVADVQRVAKKYLRPDALQILVVGNPAEVGDQLAEFGAVNMIDITIPRPVQARATVSGDADQGRMWATKMASAILPNGEAVAGVSFEATLNQGGMSLQVATQLRFPNAITQNITTPGGMLTISVADGAGSQSMGPNSQALPQAFVEAIEKQVSGHYVNVAQTLAKATVTYLGTEDLEGVSTVKLLVEETNTTWYLDSATALPLRSMSKEFNAMVGMEVESVNVYANWTLSQGVMVAYSESSMMNGQQTSSLTIRSHSVE